MADRNIMTIEITPQAQAALDGICAVTRLPKKVVVEGLLEWLAEQDTDIQVTLPGKFTPEFKARVARAVLEKMAAAERAAVPTQVSAENLRANGGGQGKDANRKSPPSSGARKPAH